MEQVKPEGNKIGILGGTFDPAHKGHIKISKIAKKKFNLNTIIWAITTQNPYKKKSLTSMNKRLICAKKINKNNKFIEVKNFENKIKSNRTIDLLRFLKVKNPNSKLYFIMGADNLIKFHKWKNFKNIIKLCRIIVFDRQGYKEKALKSFTYRKYKKENIEFIKFKKVNISSSKLRKIC